jgi:CBS domain containing-hemolysin-like protein
MVLDRDLPLLVVLAVTFVFAIGDAAAEAAFLRIPAVRVQALAAAGSRRALRLKGLTHRLTDVLNAILLVALLSHIGAATVAGILADRWFGPVGVTLATAVLTFILFIYAEAIPKTYAVRHPDRVALALSLPLLVTEFVFRPLVRVLVVIADLQMPGKTVGATPTVTEGELRMLASRAALEGEITTHDLELIERTFRFGDRQVDGIMVPRPDIVAVEEGTTARGAIEVALEAGHRRLLVYTGTMESITGVVVVRDLLRIPEGRRDQVTVGVLADPPLVVPESKRILGLLSDMQASGTHIAVVVDEYGGTAGMVTIEDIAEEMLGSISEEPSEREVVAMGPGQWMIDASLPVADLADLIDGDLDDSEWTTAAGMVLGLLGRMPQVGDEVTFGRYVIRVVGLRGRRITRLEVKSAPR